MELIYICIAIILIGALLFINWLELKFVWCFGWKGRLFRVITPEAAQATKDKFASLGIEPKSDIKSQTGIQWYILQLLTYPGAILGFILALLCFRWLDSFWRSNLPGK